MKLKLFYFSFSLSLFLSSPTLSRCCCLHNQIMLLFEKQNKTIKPNYVNHLIHVTDKNKIEIKNYNNVVKALSCQVTKSQNEN